VGTCLDDGKYAHAEWNWITDIEVHDDGPMPEVAKALLAPHLTAIHGRHGRVHLSADEHAEQLAAYQTGPVQASDLKAHFGVKAS
jgi:monoamine oxidase